MIVKHINKAFTLIELLVVIVIIGILATISTATFSGYNKKAQDVKSIANIDSIKKHIFADGTSQQDNTKYYYTDRQFGTFLDKHDLEITPPPGTCFIILTSKGAESNPDDNDFYIAMWSENTSTVDSTNEGVLAYGTPLGIKTITEFTTTNKSDFECTDSYTPPNFGSSGLSSDFIKFSGGMTNSYASEYGYSFPVTIHGTHFSNVYRVYRDGSIEDF